MSAQPPMLHTPPPRRRRWLWVLMALLVLAVVAGGLLFWEQFLGRVPWIPGPRPTPVAASAGDQPHPTTAQQALAMTPVKEHTATPGYDRRSFNFNGFDFDRNGCDTRNDILRRDLTDPVIKPGSNGCRVESGVLHDRYSGDTLSVTRDQVDIDHVVSLGNAWVSGAITWPVEKRQEFANDPLNLVATQSRFNRTKAEHDVTGWLPPHVPAQCPFVARQLAVKWRYDLAVSPAEHDVMAEVLAGCPGLPLPNGTEAPLDPHVGAPVMPRPVPPPSTPGSDPSPLGDPAEHPTATGVSPGAFCSPEGAPGLSRTGAPMRCTQLSGETRPRWRAERTE
ncbi:MAG TPA: DUF1524 domain-containing protein [Propionibacterium sp.]|nr:DUF1524 domain-containing protein [Propionibacterium sp.]